MVAVACFHFISARSIGAALDSPSVPNPRETAATTFADVRTAWNAAASRLNVPPDQLGIASASAMSAREILIETKNLPAEERPLGYALAIRALAEI